MADVLNQAFPPVNPNVISTYNYTDIAEGTGVTALNAFAVNESGGISYKLSGNAVAGTPNSSNTGGTLVNPVIFALSAFNLPKTIKGTAIIDGSFAVRSFGGTAPSGSSYIKFTIEHYDGTTATDIGNITTQTITVSGTTTTYSKFCVSINLTEKHFKRGEILRLKAEQTVTNTNPGYGLVAGSLAFDPLNGDVTDYAGTYSAATYHTNLKLYIPFKLDDVA